MFGARMKGTRKLVCELTSGHGRVVYDLNGITREDWDKLGKYTAQGDTHSDGPGGEVRNRKRKQASPSSAPRRMPPRLHTSS